MTASALFTSRRERLLWTAAIAVVAAVWSTLARVGDLAAWLRRSGLLEVSFVLGFLLVIAAIVGSGLRRRPGPRERWVAVGVAAVYAMVVVRLGVGPEERTHLFEYGLVAVLILQALLERRRNGRRVPAPALLTVVVTALLGWLDEAIQAILPTRIYDLEDVGFNALAGVMAVIASLALGKARRWDRARRRSG